MQQSVSPLVYVVDDEKVIAITLAAILRNSGFRAEAYVDPLEALKAAEAGGPDLMITDVVMPGMTGIELGIQFRTLYPDCRILLFSGQAVTGEMLEDARNDGHEFDILPKPIHPSDLLAAIKTRAGDL